MPINPTPRQPPAQTLEEARLESDLVTIGRTAEGARVLRWIIFDVAGLEEPAWSTDALTMALREGQRAAGRAVVNELRRIDTKLGADLYRAVHEARFERVIPTKEQGNAR
jgi:hypothetical protein